MFGTFFSWKRIKATAIAMALTLLVWHSAAPAYAASSPSKGAASMDQVEQRSDSVASKGPRTGKDAYVKSGELNSVQRDANAGSMNRPENSQDSTSVKEEVKDFLSNISGNS